jgi:hypothetical protein
MITQNSLKNALFYMYDNRKNRTYTFIKLV